MKPPSKKLRTVQVILTIDLTPHSYMIQEATRVENIWWRRQKSFQMVHIKIKLQLLCRYFVTELKLQTQNFSTKFWSRWLKSLESVLLFQNIRLGSILGKLMDFSQMTDTIHKFTQVSKAECGLITKVSKVRL